MFQALKTNKLFLEENIEQQLLSFFKRNIKLRNVVTYYQFAKTFNLGILAKDTLSSIESCFTMVTKSHNFLHVDYVFVAEILSSSDLEITSELEVMNAADKWIMGNYEERSKFAEDLLMKVRLHLLSDHVLKDLSRESYNTRSSSVFKRNDKCILLIKSILQNKDLVYQNKSFRYYRTRYCTRNKFNILICGGVNTITNNLDCNVVHIDGEKPNIIQLVTQFPKCKRIQVLNVNGTFYLFSNCNNKEATNVQIYCFTTNTWKNVTKIYMRVEEFSVCAFMNKIFIIGGRDKINGAAHPSFELNTDSWKKKYIERTKEARIYAMSTVYQGRIVTSGGFDDENNDLNTVEVYDHVDNTWSYMSNMIHGRNLHILVAVRNKLYVFGGLTETSEVFDSYSNKFSLVKPSSSLQGMGSWNIRGAISIGSKILIFRDNSTNVVCYDLDKEEWSEETFEVSKYLKFFLCLKMPKI